MCITVIYLSLNWSVSDVRECDYSQALLEQVNQAISDKRRW